MVFGVALLSPEKLVASAVVAQVAGLTVVTAVVRSALPGQPPWNVLTYPIDPACCAVTEPTSTIE